MRKATDFSRPVCDLRFYPLILHKVGQACQSATRIPLGPDGHCSRTGKPVASPLPTPQTRAAAPKEGGTSSPSGPQSCSLISGPPWQRMPPIPRCPPPPHLSQHSGLHHSSRNTQCSPLPRPAWHCALSHPLSIPSCSLREPLATHSCLLCPLWAIRDVVREQGASPRWRSPC